MEASGGYFIVVNVIGMMHIFYTFALLKFDKLCYNLPCSYNNCCSTHDLLLYFLHCNCLFSVFLCCYWHIVYQLGVADHDKKDLVCFKQILLCFYYSAHKAAQKTKHFTAIPAQYNAFVFTTDQYHYTSQKTKKRTFVLKKWYSPRKFLF